MYSAKNKEQYGIVMIYMQLTSMTSVHEIVRATHAVSSGFLSHGVHVAVADHVWGASGCTCVRSGAAHAAAQCMVWPEAANTRQACHVVRQLEERGGWG